MKNSSRIISIVIVIAILLAALGIHTSINSSLSKQTSTSSNTQSTSHSTTNNNTQKEASENCLTAAETWNNIGKSTCVIFYPQKFAQSKGYYFIDEKENYKSGFVVFVGKKNITSWDNFRAKYNVGKKIKVTGTIEEYQGHPQIKVYNLSQLTVIY